MQKPSKQAVKDYILERTAQDLEISQDIVDEVISWSYHKANKATHSNKEIEVSGLGKFLLSQSKLRKQIVVIERILSKIDKDDPRRPEIEERLKDYKSKCSTN